MAIDPAHIDRINVSPEPMVDATRAVAPTTLPPAPSSVSGPNPSAVSAAVQTIQSAINAGPNPSFTLDYLSGLSVVTVRSNVTGQVMYQLPDTRAVELARLIKEGQSLSSLGLFNTTA